MKIIKIIGKRPLFVITVYLALMLCSLPAFAGGPLLVCGAACISTADAHQFVWDVTHPVAYRTPSAGNLGKLSNADAVARVQKLFQVWQDVPTASITYVNAGSILPTGSYSGGAVTTLQQFNSIQDSCGKGMQSPIIFDANGSLSQALGMSPDVIGFESPCAGLPNGHFLSALVLINGAFLDGNPSNRELTDSEFDEAFVHEFGHFSGLDHSQINVEVLNQTHGQCDPKLLAGLPIMFPFAHCQARIDAGLPILSEDDKAWISFLYPETVNDPANNHVPFKNVYGTISGTILFPDGESQLPGANVLARSDANPQGVAFSVVSGYLFTGNSGQPVSGDNLDGDGFGSRNPLLIGTYAIPVLAGSYSISIESINPRFSGGSSVGPLGQFGLPIPVPGTAASKDAISIKAGAKATGINLVVINPALPRFDQFEPQ